MPDALKSQINPEKIPQHVAVIMDGNGRWAEQQGYERSFGHQNGISAVRSIIEGAGEIGISYLTLYAFSTENWDRPAAEVDMLMGLLVQSVRDELDNLMKNRVRLTIIGRLQDLPETCRDTLSSAIRETAANTGLTVSLALSYSGRTELVDAMRQIAAETRQGLLSPQQISPEIIQQHLYHGDFPNPDILIRTGGEYRISNFLLWQIAYAELFFLPILWPDFRKEDLWQVVINYQSRERRFGKTSGQIREH